MRVANCLNRMDRVRIMPSMAVYCTTIIVALASATASAQKPCRRFANSADSNA